MRRYILAGTLLGLLFVVGTVEAQAPNHWERIETGAPSYFPYTWTNNTRVFGAHVNVSEARVYNSTDAGETWSSKLIMDGVTDQVDGRNISTVDHNDGRTVVTWPGGNLTKHIAYSDDHLTWSFGNLTYPAGSIAGSDLFVDTSTHWFHATLHSSSELRVRVHETSNAGSTWNLIYNVQIQGSTPNILKDTYIRYGSSDQDLVVGSFVGFGSGTSQVNVYWSANGGNTWAAQVLESNPTSVEGSVNIGYNGDTWFALFGLEESPTVVGIAVKDCLAMTCSNFVNVSHGYFQTASVGSEAPHAISGLATAEGYSIFSAGAVQASGSESFNLQFQLVEKNGTKATVEDLTDTTHRECYTEMPSNDRPTFSCSGFFYRAETWYLPEQEDTSISGTSWNDVNVEYEVVNNYIVATHTAIGTMQRNSGSLSFLDTRDPCDELGVSDPSGVHEMAYAVNNTFGQYCGDLTETVGVGYADFVDDPRQVSMANLSFCNLEAYTRDYMVGLSCDGSLAQLIDPHNGQVRSSKSALLGNDVSVSRTGDGAWIVSDTQGFKLYTSSGGLTCEVTDRTPEAVAVEETIWVADGSNLYQYGLDCDLLRTVSAGSSTGTGQLIFSKDRRYLYRADGVRTWVHNSTTGEILGRTSDRPDVVGYAPNVIDADFLNNYLFVLSRQGTNSSISRFPIFRFTESLAGDGGSGVNPNVDPSDNPYAGVTDFGGTVVAPAAGSLFEGADDLDSVLGGSGSGRAFLGVALTIGIAGVAGTLAGGAVVAGIGAGLGAALATVMGLFPPWVIILVTMTLAAFVVARVRGG
jgi:hypothetical protein